MQPALRRFLFSVPVTVLFTAAAWGQTSAITGDVKGEDGKPVQGATVKIERKDIKGNYKVKTDKKGHYYYGGLGLGTYDITLEVSGKDVDMVKGASTQHGDATVNFDLQATAARNAAAAAAGGAAPAPEPERGLTPAQKAEYEKQKKEQEAQLAKNKELNDSFNAGMQAETAKMWDAAIDAFTKATALGPTQHVIWSHLADCYINRAGTRTGADQQADLDKGVEYYQKAIELSPQDPAYHNNFALALAKDKKMDQAQAELTKAAQLDPPQAGKYYYNLGAVLVNTQQPDAAEAAFRKAVAADPNYADAYYQIGIVLLGKATTTPQGKIVPPAGTTEAFQKYLELQPNGPNAQPAKDMLATLGTSVDTGFQRPGQKAPANTKKK